MSFRKIFGALASASVGGGVGAAYSSLRNYFTQPDTNDLLQIDARTITINLLNAIVRQFPACQMNPTAATNPQYFNVSCTDQGSSEWNQSSAFNDIGMQFQALASDYQSTYMGLANDFIHFCINTFIENIGIDTGVFAIAAAAIYLSYGTTHANSKRNRMSPTVNGDKIDLLIDKKNSVSINGGALDEQEQIEGQAPQAPGGPDDGERLVLKMA